MRRPAIPTSERAVKENGSHTKGTSASYAFSFAASEGHLYFMYADKLVTPNKPIFGTPRMAKELFFVWIAHSVPCYYVSRYIKVLRFRLDLFTRRKFV
jgi:hypothetical protein